MLTLRQRPADELEPGAKSRRTARAAVFSIVVHCFVIFGLWEAFKSTGGFQRFFVREPTVREVVDPGKLRYLTLAPAPIVATPKPTVASPGGAFNNRSGRTTGPESDAATPVIPGVPLVAPNDVPAGIPVPGKGFDVNAGAPAGGPLAAGRGPLKGIQPGYSDPRVWLQAPVLEYAPKSSEERLDSAIATSIMRYQDSVLANTYSPNRFERGDWTYKTKDGKKYGMDQQYIRLGKFSIPTALLALLPMNRMQGNPIENDRQARLAAMRVDIIAGAQAAMNEEDFRKAVKSIRQRKDKEKQQAEKQKKPVEKTISER